MRELDIPCIDDDEYFYSPLEFLKLLKNGLQLEFLLWHNLRTTSLEPRLIGGRFGVYTDNETVQAGLGIAIDQEEAAMSCLIEGESLPENWDGEELPTHILETLDRF